MKNLITCFVFFTVFQVVYSQSPQVDWLQQSGTGNIEVGGKIIRDFQGNYITLTAFKGGTTIAGQSFSQLGNALAYDYVLSKFDNNQVLDWQKHVYSTNALYQPEEINLHVDGSGNTFICFYTWTIFSANTFYIDNLSIFPGANKEGAFVTKIETNGNIAWTSTVTSSTIQLPKSYLRQNGNFVLYTTVGTTWNINGIDYSNNVGQRLIFEFSPTGNLIDTEGYGQNELEITEYKPYTSGTSLGFLNFFVFTNINGNAVISFGHWDALVCSVNSSQSITWFQQIGSNDPNGEEMIRHLKSTPTNIYAIGYTKATPGSSLTFNGIANSQQIISNIPNQGWFVSKYDHSGGLIWANFPLSAPFYSNIDILYADLDSEGSIYICGRFNGVITLSNGQIKQSNGDEDGFILKLESQTGNIGWFQQIGSAVTDEIFYVDAVEDNEIYVAARINGTTTFFDEQVTSLGADDALYAKLSGCAAPAIVINTSGPTTLCNGQSITLSTPAQTGATYAWINNNAIINGQTNNSLVVSQTGNYSVIVSLGGACVDTSDVINVQQSSTVFTIFTIPANTMGICPGNQLSLTTSIPFASYSWSNGNQSNLNAISQAGNYQVTVTDFSGCTGTATITISSFTPPPVPDIQVNSGTDCILVCISTIQPTKYKWRKNGDVVGNNSQFLDITTLGNGFYTVEITDANGCTSITSLCSITNCIDCIVGTHEQEKEKRKIRLYPNPSSGKFVCEILEKGNYRLKLFNAIGELEYSLDKVSEKSEHNFSFLANGIYILQLETEEGDKIIEKLIIQN